MNVFTKYEVVSWMWTPFPCQQNDQKVQTLQIIFLSMQELSEVFMFSHLSWIQVMKLTIKSFNIL